MTRPFNIYLSKILTSFIWNDAVCDKRGFLLPRFRKLSVSAATVSGCFHRRSEDYCPLYPDCCFDQKELPEPMDQLDQTYRPDQTDQSVDSVQQVSPVRNPDQKHRIPCMSHFRNCVRASERSLPFREPRRIPCRPYRRYSLLRYRWLLFRFSALFPRALWL